MAIRGMDWSAHIGSKVRIYRNLNNGTMSIQVKSGSWKVVGHVTEAIVRDVKFHIQEGGRQRVIKEQRKNVHAWGEGILVAQFDDSIIAPVRLGYNPYSNCTFVQRGTENPIVGCKYLAVRENLVFVSRDALVGATPKKVELKITEFSFDYFVFAA